MHTLFRLVSILLALLVGSAAFAQSARPPLKVVVGFAPGGPPDLVARRIAARLAEQTGRSVVVENRAGASGTLGAAAVAQAPADGNTLLFGVAANLAVAPANLRSPPYDPTRDFTRIVEVARGAYVRELGVTEMADIGSWRGFAGPAGLPRPIVDRLNAELRQAMADPELIATLDGWGIALSPGTPEAFGRLIAEENRRWRGKVQQLGLPLE